MMSKLTTKQEKYECVCLVGLYDYTEGYEGHALVDLDSFLLDTYLTGDHPDFEKFNFCPRCGQKINWKNVAKMAKNQDKKLEKAATREKSFSSRFYADNEGDFG